MMQIVPFVICMILGSIQTIALTSSSISIYSDWSIQPTNPCNQNIYMIQLSFLVFACLGVLFCLFTLVWPNFFVATEWKFTIIALAFVWLGVTLTSTILTQQIFTNASTNNGQNNAYNKDMKKLPQFTLCYSFVGILLLICIISIVLPENNSNSDSD